MTYREAFDIPVEEGQSVMARLGPYGSDDAGDTKITWSRGNEIEIGIARKAFNRAHKNGFVAYKMTGADGLKGEVMSEFDEAAERVILAPPMQGGR